MKSDTKAPCKQNQHEFEAKEVPGKARECVNKQIGETAIPAPKPKDTPHVSEQEV